MKPREVGTRARAGRTPCFLIIANPGRSGDRKPREDLLIVLLPVDFTRAALAKHLVEECEPRFVLHPRHGCISSTDCAIHGALALYAPIEAHKSLATLGDLDHDAPMPTKKSLAATIVNMGEMTKTEAGRLSAKELIMRIRETRPNFMLGTLPGD